MGGHVRQHGQSAAPFPVAHQEAGTLSFHKRKYCKSEIESENSSPHRLLTKTVNNITVGIDCAASRLSVASDN